MISKFDLSWIVPKFIMHDRNGYAIAKAMEAGLKYFLEKSNNGLDILLNVDKMPEWRLDEMAWEMNCLYDETADIEVKREWIRNAIPLYSIWGTKASIAEYLKGYFGEIEVQENWEYEGDPFHFQVTVGGVWTPENEAWARRAIEQDKNVRSVLDEIRIGCRCSIGIIATCGVLNRIKYPFAGELRAGEYPTENIKWEIDNITGPNIHVDDHDGRVAYDMAGEKPEINHLWKIDNVPGPNIHVEDREGRVAYDMAGEKPEINHLLALDNTPAEGDEAEEVVSTIYYPLCGEPICGE